MRFTVIPPSRRIPSPKESTWFLVQDYWNDYGFQTQYSLHFATTDSSTHVGVVKVLRKGQTASDGLQITQDFDSLDESYVSCGQSLDYYEHLAAMGAETRDMVLTALRDVVKVPNSRAAFEQEDGWKTSIFRDQDSAAINEFLLLAGSLLSGNYTSLPSEELNFSFQMNGWGESLDFNFSSGGSAEPFDWNPP